jgi:hypothetical protein
MTCRLRSRTVMLQAWAGAPRAGHDKVIQPIPASMNLFHLLATACCMFAVLTPGLVRAEEASPSPAKTIPGVEPQALEVLRRMSATLAKPRRLPTVPSVPSKYPPKPVSSSLFFHRRSCGQTSRQTPRAAQRRGSPLRFLFRWNNGLGLCSRNQCLFYGPGSADDCVCTD